MWERVGGGEGGELFERLCERCGREVRGGEKSGECLKEVERESRGV